MNLEQKKKIINAYFKSHGGFPKGAVSIDANESTVGNVMVNGTWIGTFDFEKRDFIDTN